MIRLYNYYRSSASFRVRIALNIKQIEYEKIPIQLTASEQLTKDYNTINPQGLVPTLTMEQGHITQSLAIIEYLDEMYPTPPLLPADPYQRALTRAFALAIAADIHPLNNLRVLKYLTEKFNLSEEQKTTWYHHWIMQGFDALEANLKSSPFVGRFCFGDTPTLADICLVPQMYNARRYACNLDCYPMLMRIDALCQTLPAFKNASPDMG